MKIDYIEMKSIDLAATKSFYIKAFGWTFTDWSDEYISFDNSGIEGGFALTDQPPAPSNKQSTLVVLLTDDIDNAEKKVVDAGGEIIARREFPGGKRFEFRDPSGNELAVWVKLPLE